MADKITIWHYSRCSKSRQTLSILEEEGLDPQIRLYLEDPPDVATLAEAVKKLGISPAELVRNGESLYRELNVDESQMSDDDWLALLAEHPRLIERPIVFSSRGAVIGRPPERVRDLIAHSAPPD